MKINNRIKLLLISFTCLFLCLVLFHFYAHHLIVEIDNPIVNLFRSKRIQSNSLAQIPGKSIRIRSHDGLTLNAYLTYSQSDTVNGTIILLHGIRSNKEHFTSLSRKLSSNNFQSIAIDLRAHGESEGRYCTFGFKEKKDVSLYIDYILSSKKPGPIGIWGQSLGGAIAIQALAHDQRLQFGIIESTFHSLPEIIHHYTHHFAGIDIDFLTDHVIRRAGKLAQFEPQDIIPNQFCQSITQPVLISHGAIDERIPIHYGKKNYNALRSSNKQFIEIEHAGHGDLRKVGGKKYWNQILEFLNNYQTN